MNIGKKLKSLRQTKGIGIKSLAEHLQVNYTYLSKIENNKANPSKDTIKRIATYFKCDVDELMLMADRIPDDIQQILREHPQEAVKYLRRKFSNGSQL
jgi:transcriptional regulator with XRE-family HTH domain